MTTLSHNNQVAIFLTSDFEKGPFYPPQELQDAAIDYQEGRLEQTKFEEQLKNYLKTLDVISTNPSQDVLLVKPMVKEEVESERMREFAKAYWEGKAHDLQNSPTLSSSLLPFFRVKIIKKTDKDDCLTLLNKKGLFTPEEIARYQNMTEEELFKDVMQHTLKNSINQTSENSAPSQESYDHLQIPMTLRGASNLIKIIKNRREQEQKDNQASVSNSSKPEI